MSKKMLINALHPEEARIAIVEDGHLVELDIEVAGKEQTRGNIYKGVVVRVEPGLQAAFVDIGLKRLGFLQMGEIHPGQWQWREEQPADQKNRRPRIQEILRRGQEVLVQVEKGERDMKGAALTTYISLPGRYMVLMPGDDSTGISRKVENEAERKKLKEIVSELEIPEGIGYIVRTEAVGKKNTELAKDLDYLLTTYNGILEKAKATPAPATVYQEASLVVRTIRDYFTSEIDEVLVDSKDVYKEARAFFKQTMPKFEKLVKQHQEKRPIFSKYQIEEQIDLIYEKKVPLKSGGSIIIEPTEAMVPIDVNSGKSTGEKGVEDTAFKTNMEAAAEVARQLRLRDLGGLIVIDFIDMRDRKHISEVEKALKTALKADKARVTVGKISQFGLMEMSRQRIKQTINEGIYLECPHCTGRGKLKSVEAMALSFLRKVHAAASKGTVAEVRGGLPLEVAYYLLNRKKRELAQIEDDYDIDVTVKGKTSFLLNQVELELVKREKPLDFAVEEAEITEQPAAPAEAEEKTEQPEGKKKRRRKKGPGEAGEPLAAVTAASLPEEAEPEEELEAAEGAAQEAAVEGEDGTSTGKKKRRRRRKKKPAAAGAALEAAVAETSQEMPGGEVTLRVVEEHEDEAEETAEGAEQPTEEPRKKRRRRRRRGKKPLEEVRMAEGEEPAEELAQPETVEAAPEAGTPAPEEKPEPKPKRARRKGRAAEQPAGEPAIEAAESAEPAPLEAPTTEAPAEAKPAKKRLSRVTKPTGTPEEVEAALREATRREYPKSAPEAPAETAQPVAAEPAPAAVPEAEAVIAVEEAKPKRKPRSRAKKKLEPAAVETPRPAEEPVVEPTPLQEVQEKPKRARSSAKKAPEPAPTESPEPAAPAPEAPAAEEKPKRKRAPRKKKESEQGGE